jgi:hypothetical protein
MANTSALNLYAEMISNNHFIEKLRHGLKQVAVQRGKPGAGAIMIIGLAEINRQSPIPFKSINLKFNS